jgi:hypothetical protein
MCKVSGYNRNATISNSDFAYIGGNAVASWGYTNEVAAANSLCVITDSMGGLLNFRPTLTPADLASRLRMHLRLVLMAQTENIRYTRL